jgi:hypothetical protein
MPRNPYTPETLDIESYFELQAAQEVARIKASKLTPQEKETLYGNVRREGIRLSRHGLLIKADTLENHIEHTTQILSDNHQKEATSVPRWYDKIQRLSYGLGVFQSLGDKPTQVMSYIVHESRKGIQRKLEDRTNRLSLETIHNLEKEMAFHNRWYDHFPHYKRAMQNILVSPQEDKQLFGAKWMAMGIIAYEYFESALTSRLITLPNERELGNVLLQIQDAPKPLSTLENICKQDLQVILKSHLVRRAHVEKLKETEPLKAPATTQAPTRNIILPGETSSQRPEEVISIIRTLESQKFIEPH